MGITYATVEICNPTTRRCIVRSLLVDTGSTYTWITYEDAEELGLKPKGILPITLADKSLILREWAIVDIEVDGRKAEKRPVVIRESRILGYQELEILNLKVNSPKRKLSKICIW